MNTVNDKIRNSYDAYVQFLHNVKYVAHEMILVKDDKPNNAKEYLYESQLYSKYPYGNTIISIEANKCLSGKFSAKILSDAIEERMLLRYDSEGKAHRNNYDDIPLHEQCITTPHLHRYDERGRFLAQKTESILQDENKAKGIEKGFQIFCEEGRILSATNGNSPKAFIGEMSRNLFEDDLDPCEGINFT